MLQQLRYLNLLNHPSDVVKVVVVPDTDEIFDLELVETIRGCNLAFFPSRYESWGYLQLLATNSGIPIVTTNTSGYGSFIEKHFNEQVAGYGVHVLDRYAKSDEQIIEDLVKVMHETCLKIPRDRIMDRSRAERLGHIFAWPRMLKQYLHARWSLFLTRKQGGLF